MKKMVILAALAVTALGGGTAATAQGFRVEMEVDDKIPNSTPTTTPTTTPTATPTTQQSGKGASGTFTDPRNGKSYRTTQIGGKRWFAENLNYATGNSWCYNNDNANCAKYGRLYDWNTARSACPAGFHLPSREEWRDLCKAVGGEKKPDGYSVAWIGAGNKLKAKSGWSDNGNGTDNYGFSALPAGSRNAAERFGFIGERGWWWTTTTTDGGYVYSRSMINAYDGVYEPIDGATNDNRVGQSVRCVGN